MGETGETFEIHLVVLDEWGGSNRHGPNEKYRLVNLGAGPDQIQEFVDGDWKQVSRCYEWGIATKRIVELKRDFLKGIKDERQGDYDLGQRPES